MHASRVDVDVLLKNLGAEPFFNNTSINDPHTVHTSPHVPPLSVNNKPLAITYPAQHDQNALSDAFVSLLQRINGQQNIQNLQNTQNTQTIQNLQSLQSSPNSQFLQNSPN